VVELVNVDIDERVLVPGVGNPRLNRGAVPTTVELMIDGFYAVVHQQEGWPRRWSAVKPPPLYRPK
jgi:hypothetical protein